MVFLSLILKIKLSEAVFEVNGFRIESFGQKKLGRTMKFSTSEIIFDLYLGLSPFSSVK